MRCSLMYSIIYMHSIVLLMYSISYMHSITLLMRYKSDSSRTAEDSQAEG